MTFTDQKLYGLVLAGGKSTRMGQDKSGIVYFDKPQVQVAFDLLEKFCPKVFLSNRKDQAGLTVYQPFQQIHDGVDFEGKGPLGGILSAMTLYPDASWVVLACDLPFVTESTIKHLIAKRNQSVVATAYKSSHDGLPEPLCAVWESGYRSVIFEMFSHGLQCPRKVLIRLNAQVLEPLDPKALDNINDPNEYQTALKNLKRS